MFVFTNILLCIFRQPNAPQTYPGAPPPAEGKLRYYSVNFCDYHLRYPFRGSKNGTEGYNGLKSHSLV